MVLTDRHLVTSFIFYRYLDKVIIEGKRNGLNLPEEEREKVKIIKKRISELGVNFNKNLNEDTSHAYFTVSALLLAEFWSYDQIKHYYWLNFGHLIK